MIATRPRVATVLGGQDFRPLYRSQPVTWSLRANSLQPHDLRDTAGRQVAEWADDGQIRNHRFLNRRPFAKGAVYRPATADNASGPSPRFPHRDNPRSPSGPVTAWPSSSRSTQMPWRPRRHREAALRKLSATRRGRRQRRVVFSWTRRVVRPWLRISARIRHRQP
jgi:hypothetical protein